MKTIPLRIATIIFSMITYNGIAWADPISVRWTGSEDKNSEFNHILDVLNAKTKLKLKSSDFQILENRDLARDHFQMRVQTYQGIPMHNRSIRIWTALKTGEITQVEASVEKPSARLSQIADELGITADLGALRAQLSSTETMSLIHSWMQQKAEDSQIRSVQWKDVWSEGSLIRLAQVKGRRGVHQLRIALMGHPHVLSASYKEYPQADEFELPALVYPIYEKSDDSGATTPRISAQLKHLKTRIARVNEDPFSPLRTRKYLSSDFDPVLGEIEEERAKGYWSMNYVKSEAAKIRASLPLSDNSPEAGGIILEGTYATVNLHPDVLKKFSNLNFTPRLSAEFIPNWDSSWDEMTPSASYLGKPLLSLEESLKRPARQLEDQNPVEYMNDGFDEVQVYYAINTLFDSLRSKGFVDPELSTRPFNAFLYNPDISMRDNAFYTDDTINFTTYSPHSGNMARDNSTIWHELGHGVMDRLMGDQIQLADTGGLSEGMADFVADLVIQDVTQGQPFAGSNDFRIINGTGFYLTNEVHDDGEAYGGTMHDFLKLCMDQFGIQGLTKVTDLTMSAMRLTRNHPGLTAPEWFKHMLFADELGNEDVRSPGELRGLLLQALAHRNFNLDDKPHATFLLKNGDSEVLSSGPGSREQPVILRPTPENPGLYHLSASIKNGEDFQFKFPVQVKVTFNQGALQGAIHWADKEKGPLLFTLNSPADVAKFDLRVEGVCDYSNREDGSCVDYAYVQIWNQGETLKPQAKKRFYVRLYPNG